MKRCIFVGTVCWARCAAISPARVAAVLLALVGTACGDDTTGSGGGSTSAGNGGGDGSGGEAATTTTSTSATTTTSTGATTSAATTSSTGGAGGDIGAGGSGGSGGATGSGGSGGIGEAACEDLPAACAADWEQTASDTFDGLVAGDPDDLALFLRDVPKGADLHNHLSGAVYAETYLGWADRDDICIEPDTFRAETSCDASNDPVPDASDAFYQDIVEAWSMENFVPGGAESGHDHFFATFGKFGAIAGTRRNDSLADIAIRAAEENIVHLETMFNLGRNIGELSDDIWVGSLTEGDLAGLYQDIISDPSFDAEVDNDVNVVTGAYSAYRSVLGCSGANPSAACDVSMRFVAQVSRVGGNPMIFGQLISAFEMAKRTPYLVAANLSSPEDDPASINNYNLHMAMLGFLHEQYAETGNSPLEITLHAGELTEEFLPKGSDANTFHIRAAVETARADRIGHGLDIFSETDPEGLMADMADLGVLVEVCLSSNVQILEVSGSDHPLADYIAAGVPVALATDDQGVSRSSLAGEYLLAATDQQLSYRQLKTMARDSLEHAFLPGDSLWDSVADADPVGDCAPTATMGIGSEPNLLCQQFLDGSERARAQWELERRFRVFESNL